MDRRDFIKSACQACAALAIAPAAIATLEGCGSTAKLAVENGAVSLPADSLGSSGTAVVSAKGLGNKIMVVKRPDGSYTALELNCPHKGGPVKEKGGQLVCGWHGSAFDMNGDLLKGPAKTGLKTYPVEADGNMLRVRVA